MAKANFEGGRRSRLGLVRIIFFLVLVAAGIIFVLQNRTETVQLHVFSHYFYPHLSWFTLSTLGLGVVLGVVIGRLTKRSARGSS